MAKQNEHGKLIAAAGKAALLPLGFRRKGQSRSWFSDERFWSIFVEFQPSAWSKGTYLNITPIWFFLEGWGGEAAHRLDGFISFESIEQFSPLIEQAAQRLAAEAMMLRAKFRTLADVHRSFAGNLSWSGNIYRAAVTGGLIGDLALARQLFERIAQLDPAKHGRKLPIIQKECAVLAALLDNPEAYRLVLFEKVAARRQARGFPLDPQCFEGRIPQVRGVG
jgi:hypothetical protein